MSSYELSQKHNFQTYLWAIGGAIAAVVRLPVALIRFSVTQAYRLGASLLLLLLAASGVLGAVARLLWALGCFTMPIMTKMDVGGAPVAWCAFCGRGGGVRYRCLPSNRGGRRHHCGLCLGDIPTKDGVTMKLPDNFAKLPLAERQAILEELKRRYTELKAQEQTGTMTQTVIVSMN